MDSVDRSERWRRGDRARGAGERASERVRDTKYLYQHRRPSLDILSFLSLFSSTFLFLDLALPHRHHHRGTLPPSPCVACCDNRRPFSGLRPVHPRPCLASARRTRPGTPPPALPSSPFFPYNIPTPTHTHTQSLTRQESLLKSDTSPAPGILTHHLRPASCQQQACSPPSPY